MPSTDTPQAELPAQPDSSLTKAELFLRWLEENGATFPLIRLQLEPGAREIYLNQPVVRGQLLMHIPRQLMITDELAKASEIGQLVQSHNRWLSSSGYMAAFLLMNRSEGGFFKPYIDILPEYLSDNPMFFSEDELAYLKGSFALREIRTQISGTKYEYRQLDGLLAADRMFTEQEYFWAKAIVRTRGHSVIVNGKKGTALVPLACMLNHSPYRNTLWQLQSDCGFTYAAAEALAEGIPLTISYGKGKGNSKLYKTYGFCVPDNPRDNTELWFPEPKEDKTAAALARTLGDALKGMRAFTPIADCKDATVRDMLSYLRLLHLDEADAARLPPVSRENELAALGMLATACRDNLSGFETSIEEDEVLLAGAGLSQNLRNAVCVRHGEKVVLRYLLQLAEAGMALLQGQEPAHAFPAYFETLQPLLAEGGQ